MDLWILYLLIAALLAVGPAKIAADKGHDPVKWWLFGFALWIVAFPAAFLIKPTKEVEARTALDSGDFKKCPQCAELVKSDAIKCRFCGHDFPPPGSMRCPGCRELIPELAVRCRHCGHRFTRRPFMDREEKR